MPPKPTRVLAVDPADPDPQVLREAAAILRAGGLVAFPTETVYGLGANALDAPAVRRIFEAKGRPPTNPLIVHVGGPEMARRIVAEWPSLAQRAADHFWPGPLTLVLPKGEEVPADVTAGGPTVAVRMPAHRVALGLIRETGVPLAAPSANRSGELSPTRAQHVLGALGGRIDLILDAGPTHSGIESTVVDLTTEPPTLLRPGPVSPAELESVLGPIRHRAGAPIGPLPSPGLMARHYAPRTPLELHESRTGLEERAAELRNRGKAFGEIVLGGEDGNTGRRVAMPDGPREYAARLYDVLHNLDVMRLDLVLVELPPDAEQWVAVRDRLVRAAAR